MTVPRVHVKGFGDNGEKEELRRLFIQFGPLTNVWIATRPPGFAYVFFEAFEDAEKAVEFYDGKEICGAPCKVELSPIEDKPRVHKDPPIKRGGFHGESRRGSFHRDRGREFGSGRTQRQDHDRERHPRRDSYSREDSSYRGRGRPFSRGGGGRGASHERGERRHSFPDRHGGSFRGSNSRGYHEPRHRHSEMGHHERGRPDFERGRPDFERGRPEFERGRPDFETRHRGSSGNSHPSKYEHSSRPHHHSRPDHYSNHGRGNIPRAHHERGRPVREFSSRGRSPEPPHRRHRTHSTEGEYKGMRDYDRPQRVRESREHGRHLSERSRIMERNYDDDVDYRENRRLKREEAQLRRIRKYELDYPNPKKTHHSRSFAEPPPPPPPRPSHRRQRYEYETEEYFDPKVILEPEPIRERSPLSPKYVNDNFSPQYRSPEPSRSRSRSVGSMSSDTSRGFSASPSPRRELPPEHQPGSPPLSPGTPAVSPPNNFGHSEEKRISRSPSPVYRSQTPQYGDRTPEYVIEQPSTELFVESPSYNGPGLPESPRRYVEEASFKESREIEYEEHPPYKKSSREVRERDHVRKVSYNEKHGSKDRYIEVDVRRDGGDVRRDGGDVRRDGGDVRRDGGDVRRDGGDVRRDGGDMRRDGGDRKRHRGRIVSESRDGLGSGHGSSHSSPKMRESSSKRRRSTHKEEHLKSEGRRQVQALSPVSDRMVLNL